MRWPLALFLMIYLGTCTPIPRVNYFTGLEFPENTTMAFIERPAATQTVPQIEQELEDDGYYFEGRERIFQGQVRWVFYPSLKALRGMACRAGRPNCERIMGMTSYGRSSGATCYIHAVDPAAEYRPRTLGHEITHCLYGNWHREQERFR